MARVQARRRRRLDVLRLLGVAALAALAAALSVAVIFWATDTWRIGGPDSPTLAAKATPSPVRKVTGVPCRSPLTPDNPLRLWIGGDSLAGTLGPSLGTLAGDTGVVQPTVDSRPSSALSNPDFFDWPQHATQQLPRLDPELVVFIIGANDAKVPQSQPTDLNGTPTWRGRYALLVQQMLDILGANNRFVFWVGAPTLRDSASDAGVRQVNDVARSVVERHPNATYVDAYQLFSDSQGHYSAQLAGPGGKQELVRADDGVHFTPAGGDLLARAIFGPFDARCRLEAQAVPDASKHVIEVPGATQVPPTPSRGPSAPATQPTSPPTTVPSAPPPTSTPPSSGNVRLVP